MNKKTEVDHAEIRFGQIMVILSMSAAYITASWEIVAIVGIFFLLASISFRIGPFNNIYRLLFKATGVIKPDMRFDNMEPHRFGQAVGFVTAAIAAGLIFTGFANAGWIVVWILIALTALSYSGWCVGCFIYYMLNKLGLGGFFSHSPTDKSVITGARPRRNSAM